MSPEQFSGQSSTRSDIYSLGLLVFEMLTGQHPYAPAKGFNDWMESHLKRTLPDICSVRTDLPQDVNVVLQRACAKDPDARYSQAIDFITALDEAFEEEDTERHGATRRISIVYTDAPNPYRGLRSFDEADYLNFYGRDKLVEQLLQRLQEPDAPHRRFLAVVGASGSGKSSVVQAGLMQALRRGKGPDGSDNWLYISMTPTAQPYDALEEALRQVAAHSLPNLGELLRQDNGLLEALHKIAPNQHVFLLIDQFEELFTLTDDEQARSFTEMLCANVAKADGPLTVVITLRADFYDQALQYPRFGELLAQRNESVGPMSEDELQSIIQMPIKRLGITIENKLVTAIINDLRDQPGMLPLLEYTLTELFEKRSGHSLTIERYHDLGGVRGAVSKRANDLYDQLSDEEKSLARDLFLRLVNLGEGTADTRRRALQSELYSLGGERILKVMDRFEQARLLTYDYEMATRLPLVEVAHESLIRQWPLLLDWLKEARNDLRQQRSLHQAAREWEESGHAEDYLLHGIRLEALKAWSKSSSLKLSKLERSYLEESIALHERMVRARLKREQTVRWLWATLVLVLLLGLSISLALFAEAQRQRDVAERERETAQSERDEAERRARENKSLSLSRSAQQNLAAGDPFRSVAEALQAVSIDNPPPEAQRTLADIAWRGGVRRVLKGHTNRVWSVHISPDGRWIASGGQDGTVRLWDAASGDVVRIMSGHDENRRVYDVAFFPDSTRLASVSQDGTLIVWDVATGDMIYRQTISDQVAWSVAISPDARTIVTAINDGRVQMWNAEDGSLIREMRRHSAPVIDAVISPDGRLLASASADQTIRLWDMESGDFLRILGGHSDVVASIAFSADGKRLLSGSADLRMILWDVASGEQLMVLNANKEGHEIGPIRTVALDPEGRIALSGSFDGQLIAWDLRTGNILRRYRGHRAWVLDVAISPDGHTAITASGDSYLISWDITERGAEIWRIAQEGEPTTLATAPNNQQIAIGAAEGQLVAHDPATGEALWERQWPARIQSLAYHPDGTQLAVGLASGHIGIVSSADGTVRQSFTLDAPVWAVQFSPDGRLLASASGATQVGGRHLGASEVVIWSVQEGVRLASHQAHGAPPRALTFNTRGTLLYSGGDDGQVLAWSWTDGALSRLAEGLNSVRALALDALGTRLAIGGREGTITLISLSDDSLKKTELQDNHSIIRSLLFVNDNQLLSAGGDVDALSPSIALWSLEAGEVIREYRGHERRILGLGLSKDMTTFYSVAEDGLLIRWRLDDLNSLRDWLYAQADVPCLEDAENDPRCVVVDYVTPPDDETLRLIVPTRSSSYVSRATSLAPYSACQFVSERKPTLAPIDAPRPLGWRVGISVLQAQRAWLNEAQQHAQAMSSPPSALLLDAAADSEAQDATLAAWLAEPAVDVLIVAMDPKAPQRLNERLAQAEALGVVVLLLGGNTPDSRAVSVIGISDYHYGCVQGQEMVAELDAEGIIVRLQNRQDMVRARRIEDGLLNVIDAHPELSVVHVVQGQTLSDAQDALITAFNINKRVDAITVDDSTLAQLMAQALLERPGLEPPLLIGGNDPQVVAQLLARGLPQVVIDSEPLGALALETAQQLVNGEPIYAFTEARLRTYSTMDDIRAWLEAETALSAF